ncbi:GNAT family N-acetyltransferase [Amycolatopsis sp. 3B14]|uniref:GNAT family N-acetyltransferase n=1 Tax=Amycolatopsis sp. 3B14 TaxID=3243600 RepID=UPI003D977E57
MLDEAVRALRTWQHDAAPVQLHPGDLGWFWRFGAHATAEAVRTWSRDGRIVAVGLLDEPGLLRLTVAPDLRRDEELARRLADDLTRPERGVLPAGEVFLETPPGALVRDLLRGDGWHDGDAWTPLVRDLAAPVGDPGLRIEVTGPERAHVRAAVQRAAFDGSAFTTEQWRDMASAPSYADARCLVGHDQDTPVAAVTVWSAGPGRPGLLEPMGVHRDHRGCGHGRAITLAAAAALRELGSSCAFVCTPSTNAAAVATYRSAGFRPLPERLDLRRAA